MTSWKTPLDLLDKEVLIENLLLQIKFLEEKLNKKRKQNKKLKRKLK